MDWLLPTNIQAEAIPLILGGGDVLMAAETGSGKTGAFSLPVLQVVWETIRNIQSGHMSSQSAQASSASTGAGGQWVLSVYDRSPGMAVSQPAGLKCQSREPQWNGIRCAQGVVNGGRYYYEATVSDEGLCRVGWSAGEASLDLGTCRWGFGYGGTGKKSNGRQFDDYGGPFGLDDVIGCGIDLDAGQIVFWKNGQDLGVAFHIPAFLKNRVFFPALVLKNAEMDLNFGEQPFKNEPPAGYVGVCHAAADRRAANPNCGAAAGAPVSLKPNAPQALVLEPSRELAEQTLRELDSFKRHLAAPEVRTMLAVGGQPVKEQLRQLAAGVDIVVGTPGRIEELTKNDSLVLTQCRFLVLDEADGLLQQGHGNLIGRLHSRTPKTTPDGKRLQMIVCSATLHSVDVKKMAERLMRFPTWVDLKGEDAVPETVHHSVVMVDPRVDRSWSDAPKQKRIATDGVHDQDRVQTASETPEMMSRAVKLLKGEYCARAIREHRMERAIIFCRTKMDCDNLEAFFNALGKDEFSCVCLHGDRNPQERRSNLDSFKRQRVKFLICTDVAARGLDIHGLPFMINMTLPDEKSNYVHRIGRVGRADRMGLALSFVSQVPEKVWYHGDWCPFRGKGCTNSRLTSQGGCCIWYNELQCLADIEEHLGVTIASIGTDMKVPVDEFDGKVTYGQKRKAAGPSAYHNHVAQMAPAVRDLALLECQTQLTYLRQHAGTIY